MNPKKREVRVDQNPEEIIERPVLAKAIVDISHAMKKLLASGLNQRAIVCLVHDTCNVGKPDIRAVLESLESLSRNYCK
jgi:hypothetical protein